MPQNEELTEIKRLLEKQTKLLEGNERLLKKIHRYYVWGFLFHILWYAIIIGLPFLVYFYFLEPYIQSFGASYESLMLNLDTLPWFQGFQR